MMRKVWYWNRCEWSEKFRRDFKTSTICNSLWTAFGSMVISFVGMTEHDPKEIISDFWKLISNIQGIQTKLTRKLAAVTPNFQLTLHLWALQNNHFWSC